MQKIELLIPARNLEAGRAAVDHGADAVYIGGPAFGARAAAGNPVEDIASLVDHARPYGVRVYAALNTLVYEDELKTAERTARELVDAGVDALIIQDPAYLMMGIEGVPFHASTQMCNTTAEKVEFLARSGFSRVILERGLTLEEIRGINSRCGVETECFVHGAICVGHSGRCYLSRSMGPRSGNRGECGQPCRLRYDLEDGDGNILIKNKHLMSVRDLNLSGRVGELIDAGVMSFKVEGRLKDTEYVRNITSFYRAVLDREIALREDVERSSEGVSRGDITPDPAKSFSRGFTVWTLDGKQRGSASFDTPKSLGEPLGTVKKVGRDYFTLAGGGPELSPGDGICFISKGDLLGTGVNRVEAGKIYPDKINGIAAGTEVYRNHDHKFNLSLSRSRTRRVLPVKLEYRLAEGGLRASFTDPGGTRVEGFLPTESEIATDPYRMLATLSTQLAKTGDTVFEVAETTFEGNQGSVPFFRVSALNAFRRDITAKLLDKRLAAFEKEKKGIAANTLRDDAFPYPVTHLGGEGNITNTLSARFWKNHGVTAHDEPYDLRSDLSGQVVMTTPYCIRRELGTCLKNNPPDAKTNLYLRTANHRFLLIFDCQHCLMNLQKCKN